jgi:hypothetical protein
MNEEILKRELRLISRGIRTRRRENIFFIFLKLKARDVLLKSKKKGVVNSI